MAYKRKLKNLLINPQFQLKLLSYFVGLFVLHTLSLYSTSFLFFYRLEQKALSVGIPKSHVFFKFIENQKWDLDFLFIFLTLVNLIFLFGVGFLVSHRIAGPLYKLKNYLLNLDVDSSPFKLRSKDFLKDLEPVVNDLKEKIK